MFIGYDQKAGGSWSGDLLVVDWDELENAETAAEIHVKRIGAKEVLSNPKTIIPLGGQPMPSTQHLHVRKSRSSRT